ncbi:MAG: ATP-binding cassette domain-containing protein [Pseudomonadales bacterium]
MSDLDALAWQAQALPLDRSRALSSRFENLPRCIAQSAPMVVPLRRSGHAVLVARAGRRSATLLTPDGDQRRVPIQALVDEITPVDPAEASLAKLEREAGATIADTLRRERRRNQRVFAGWQLPPDQESSAIGLWNRQMMVRIGVLLGAHVLHFCLWLVSWVALVGALLSAGDRTSLLLLWVIALATALLLLPVESLLQQNLATRLGVAIKQALLRNALGMDQAAVRQCGIGQLIARALEANRLDSLATQGGLRVLLAALDSIVIVALFIWFAGLQPLLLLFVAAGALAACWWTAYYRAAERLHAAHLDLTALHTEEMIGHRTRKAFVGRSNWHAQEEQRLTGYERACAATDRAELGAGAVPRLWAVAGVAVILVSLFDRGAATVDSVAMIGFVIVAYGVLQSASTGIMNLLRALVSWNYLGGLQRQSTPAVAPQAHPQAAADPGSRLIVDGLGYAYPGSARQVVRDAHLELQGTEKLLLTGDSGSGKSTLGALLSGSLQPASGTVLSQGMDRHVLGAREWLKHVCCVPQSGRNHVLTDTFAFNLLLGRAWPPSAEDLEEAREVAELVGLGPLLEKMPAGMMQMVGEGGWRLSLGERARLFLARGILQRARVLVIDELLSPLDPVSGLSVLKAVERLPSQLILIEHS